MTYTGVLSLKLEIQLYTRRYARCFLREIFILSGFADSRQGSLTGCIITTINADAAYLFSWPLFEGQYAFFTCKLPRLVKVFLNEILDSQSIVINLARYNLGLLRISR